ncbi:MAG: hypothetical protein QXQ29_06720, partial [Candidatus Bathyarchaeia archaeon]
EEVADLREGQNKLWEEVKGLSFNFRQLGRALGMTLEYYTAAFIERYLVERGYPIEKLKIGVEVNIMYKGRSIEVDILNEDPLIVGEVTTYLGSAKEAEGEADKLLERVRIIEEIYGRSVELKILAVANLVSEAAEALEKLAYRYGLMILTGREVEYPG